MIFETGGHPQIPPDNGRGKRSLKLIRHAGATLLLALCAAPPLWAQTAPPVVIAPPVDDAIDQNNVSVLSGEEQFTIPAIKMGDVSFTPFSLDYSHFGIATDENYGRIADCEPSSGFGTQPGTSECTTSGSGIQAIYGEERGSFDYVAGRYQGEAEDGSTFTDNGSTCTWTQRDGTQIVYAAYHAPGNQMCQSNNILEVIKPNGRITTYYYYGALSATYGTPSPILSIVTNSGYMLKYNYSGTPSWGVETSVVAINRAFEACVPTALSCTLTHTWPTATIGWTSLGANTSDPATPATKFTIQDEAGRHYVFGIDSYARVAWYQPPNATQPVYYYSLCTLERDSVHMENCFGITTWTHDPVFDVAPVIWDWVNSVTKVDYTTGNGSATWFYSYSLAQNGGHCPLVGCSELIHYVTSPLGVGMSTSGNMTGGNTYSFWGPTEYVSQYDGTVDHYERNTRNKILTRLTPLGVLSTYGYDSRGNLTSLVKTPIVGRGQSTIQESAGYPGSTCTNIVICNRPTFTEDFKTNTWNFTYDPTHGGVLTETGPAVNGVQPQNRYFYTQEHAWYLSSSGVMIQDPNPIWLLTAESYCMSGAAASPVGPPGAGCTKANDEVVISYDYGPQSGPNNLLLRGKTVTAQGQTLRTCYGHDPQGNKTSETSPNANLSSCPGY
jgi:YD repeat-containing protein